MPGIGKRTAERIIVELREKVGVDACADEPIVVTRALPTTRARSRATGLVELGYAPRRPTSCSHGAEGETPRS